MASMENLHNLGLPKRHGEPKPKTQRTMKNVITELVHKFGNYPTSQITEIYNAVLANLDRDIQLRVVSGEEQEVALKSLEALKGAGTSLGKDVRVIICLTDEPLLKTLTKEEQRKFGVTSHVFARMNEIRERMNKGISAFCCESSPGASPEE